jgi:PKD domain-containing protein
VTAPGPQTVTIQARDPAGETGTLSFTVNADPAANRPPVASAGPDEVVECSGQAGTPVTLNGSDSDDPDGDALTFRWTGPFGTATGRTPTVTLPDGASTITLTVTDELGATATDTVVITVVDTRPPTIESASADPAVLLPPNHRMVPVTVAVTATDVCSPTVRCAISGVASNEPIDGTGDGHSSPDWTITGDLTVDLRAERAGGGDGRIYTITVRCTDESGNAATAPVEVRVPHNR